MTRTTPRITVPRMLLTLTPAVLVAAVAVGLVGGTRATEASAGENPGTRAAEASVGENSGTRATPASAGGNPGTPVAGCLTDDLTGTVTGLPQQSRPGVRDVLLHLTNTSGTACQVSGWADIALVTPPGELVRVPAREFGQAAAAPLVLQPEAGVWSRIAWDVCSPGGAGCGVGVALQFIVDPESTGSVAEMIGAPEPDEDGIAMTAMRVGPLQATRDAALL